MNDGIKLFLRKNIDRNEYEKLKVIYDEKWLDKIIKYINRFYDECFFALGKIDDVIISSIYITKHPEQNDFYLISDFNIVEEYKDKIFTNYIIESVLNILKDLNCVKVGAFVQKEYEDVYKNIGFKKVSDDYIFGNDKRSNSSYDPYYEIEIKQDYYCEEINEYTSSIISKFITDKKYKHSQEVPNYFKPNSIMIKQSLLYSNTLDNEVVYAIMNGKIVFGYSKMYYDNNTLYLRIDMREDCLYNNAIKIVLEKAKEYVSNIKEEVNNIIFYVNDNLLLKSEFDFYRKVLTQNGFKTNDDIEYKYEFK